MGQVTDADGFKNLDTFLDGLGLCRRGGLFGFFLFALWPPQPPRAVLIFPIGAESSAVLTFSTEAFFQAFSAMALFFGSRNEWVE